MDFKERMAAKGITGVAVDVYGYASFWEAQWTLEAITAKFGASHVAYIRAQPFPASFCECRAAGEWQANDAESHSAYKSLAAILTAEVAAAT